MSERNRGIDYLRIIAMILICSTHVLRFADVFEIYMHGSFEYEFYLLLDTINATGVVVFALISGYVATESNSIDFRRMLQFWFQGLFYSFVLKVFFCLCGVQYDWNIKNVLISILPVTGNDYWYLSAYFGLLMTKPFLDKAIFKMNKKGLRALIVCVCCMGCSSMLFDSFRLNWGYSFVWLSMLYCVGAAIKQVGLFQSVKTCWLVVTQIVFVMLTWLIWSVSGSEKISLYVSPTVVGIAMLAVIISSRVTANLRFLNAIVPLLFGVYLFQCSSYVWSIMKELLSCVCDYGFWSGLAIIVCSIFGLFIVGLAVEFARKLLYSAMRMDELYIKLDVCINKMWLKVCENDNS